MRVFLSHSSLDKPFVRRLHEALTLRGINTFFDERDIRVGDDIRIAIEQGVAESTHLIYVISAHSVKSRWVQEELSIGTTRRMEQREYKVLPVLIEKIDLPPGIRHIKYADFRNWELGEPFFSGLRELMTGLGVPPEILTEAGLSFSVAVSPRLLAYETLFRKFSSEARGMLAGWIEGVSLTGRPYTESEDNISAMVQQLSERVGVQSALKSVDEILTPWPTDTAREIRQLVAITMEQSTTLETTRLQLSVDYLVDLASLSKQIADKLTIILHQSVSAAHTFLEHSTPSGDRNTA